MNNRSRLVTQSRTMMRDTCVILTATMGSNNAYGYATQASYTEGDPIPCAVDRVQSAVVEVEDSPQNVPVESATFLLPPGTVVTSLDRIKLTHRMGVAITPVLYQVSGDPFPEPLMLKVQAKLVIATS